MNADRKNRSHQLSSPACFASSPELREEFKDGVETKLTNLKETKTNKD
jgi:hypothetical protein